METITKEPRSLRIMRKLLPNINQYLANFAAVSSRVSDLDQGWQRLAGTPLDLGWSDLSATFDDALEAWRKNPLCRRIVSLTADFVVGDGISLSSEYKPLDDFIQTWWFHEQNTMDLRLESMCDGLTMFGELFPVLSFNSNGMSYIRFKPPRYIDQIRWREGDYETETEYHETGDLAGNVEGRWWTSPQHPDASKAQQVMLHYAINRQIGCTRGESDLAPALIWLKRYSHWLEDRARLNWATRMFLWFVRVPTTKLNEKRQQYKSPPEAGSIIVHDDGEEWDLKTPAINAREAKDDGRAIKRMAAVSTGTPLHWLSDEENANLATAEAMQGPATRHYSRRQRYFCYTLRHLAAYAYNEWLRRGNHRWAPHNYQHVDATVQQIVKEDNLKLAQAAREIVQMLADLRRQLTEAQLFPTDALNRKTVELAFRFAGEILTAEQITQLLQEEEQP